MRFTDPLVRGTLIRRYKRFLVDVDLGNGETVVAHCANPGSMLSVNEPGSRIWVSPARNPKRKLRWSWELIEVGETLVGINTAHPNDLVEEAILDGTIVELQGYETLRREIRYGRNSRIDILLEDTNRPRCYVEIKNVTMRRTLSGGPAEFPDSVTLRGAKHLVELAGMVAEGHRAVMVYLVQRGDAEAFALARDIDPDYAEGLESARHAGVEALCYACDITPEEINVSRRIDKWVV